MLFYLSLFIFFVCKYFSFWVRICSRRTKLRGVKPAWLKSFSGGAPQASALSIDETLGEVLKALKASCIRSDPVSPSSSPANFTPVSRYQRDQPQSAVCQASGAGGGVKASGRVAGGGEVSDIPPPHASAAAGLQEAFWKRSCGSAARCETLFWGFWREQPGRWLTEVQRKRKVFLKSPGRSGGRTVVHGSLCTVHRGAVQLLHAALILQTCSSSADGEAVEAWEDPPPFSSHRPVIYKTLVLSLEQEGGGGGGGRAWFMEETLSLITGRTGLMCAAPMAPVTQWWGGHRRWHIHSFAAVDARDHVCAECSSCVHKMCKNIQLGCKKKNPFRSSGFKSKEESWRENGAASAGKASMEIWLAVTVSQGESLTERRQRQHVWDKTPAFNETLFTKTLLQIFSSTLEPDGCFILKVLTWAETAAEASLKWRFVFFIHTETEFYELLNKLRLFGHDWCKNNSKLQENLWICDHFYCAFIKNQCKTFH